MKVIEEIIYQQNQFIYENRPEQYPILLIGAISYSKLLNQFNDYQNYNNIIENLSKDEKKIYDEIINNQTWKMLQVLCNEYYVSNSHLQLSFEEYILKISECNVKTYIFPFHKTLTINKISSSFKNKKIRKQVYDLFESHPYNNQILNFVYNYSIQEIKNILIRHLKFACNLVINEKNATYSVKRIKRDQIVDSELIEVIQKYEKTGKNIRLVNQTAYKPFILVSENLNEIILYIPPIEESIATPNIDKVTSLKAMADTIRLQILREIKMGNNSLNQLTKNIDASKPTIHHHIQKMKHNNILIQKNNNYFVNDEEIEKIFNYVHKFIGTKYE
ncbi:ArsR/SmtB family transcription factor [Macrococcus sp. EM39E]|uniref:ArsR/SmtB family transcription factor n=1 Tax=Macrococcus animalis TaxID=3395467 RepID=UPI0039BE0854